MKTVGKKEVTKSIALTPQGSSPTATEGEVFYDSGIHKLKMRDSAADREVISLDSDGKMPAKDGSKLTNLPYVPIGGIIPWAKNIPGCPALSVNFQECDGSVINNGLSPMNGQTTPPMNNQNRFIRGNTSSGATGGTTSHTHTETCNIFSKSISLGTGGNDLILGPIGLPETSSAGTLPPYYNAVWVMRIY